MTSGIWILRIHGEQRTAPAPVEFRVKAT
jgi:hypothetical protein